MQYVTLNSKEKENELGELFEFVNILQNATFRGIEYAMANCNVIPFEPSINN